MNCTLCELHQNAKTVGVPYRGPYKNPDIMFVGIAPGATEDIEGQCFIGPTGDLLNQLIREVGGDPDRCSFDNVVKCFPNEMGMTVDPDDHHILSCSPFLYYRIKAVNPKIIVPLGNIPLKALTGEWGITNHRGWVHRSQIAGCKRDVLPTFHPSSILRGATENRPLIKKDILEAWRLATGIYYLPPVNVINDTDQAAAYLEDLIHKYERGIIKWVAIDSETSNLILERGEAREFGLELANVALYDQNEKIVSLSFSYIEDEENVDFRQVLGTAIPMFHPESKINYKLLQSVFNYAFDRRRKAIPTVYHNHKFDGSWFWEKLETDVVLKHDTMMMSSGIYGTSRSHGLGPLSHEILLYDPYKDETDDALWSLPANQRRYTNLPLRMVAERNAVDAAATASLYVYFNKLVDEAAKKDRPKLKSTLLPLLRGSSEFFKKAELKGIAVDMDRLNYHIDRYPKLREDKRRLMLDVPMTQLYCASKGFNPGTPDNPFPEFNPKSPFTKELIFSPQYFRIPIEFTHETEASTPENRKYAADEIFQVGIIKHARSYKWDTVDGKTIQVPNLYDGSCSCRALHIGDQGVQYVGLGEGLGDPHPDIYQFMQNFRMYSKILKIESYLANIQGFFRPMEWQVRNQVPENLRVLVFNFLLHWVKTGRLSTRDYSVHTMPWHSDIRRLLVSRWLNQGGLLLSADYSQLEVRVGAALSKDPELIEAYRQGKDFHRFTASGVWQIPEDQVTAAMRRYSKTMTFRLFYGGGAQSIADETGLSVDQAQDMIDRFLARFKGVDEFIKWCHNMVENHGYVDTMAGRRFFLEGIFSSNRGDRAEALRESQNYPVQSFAGDIGTAAAIMTEQKATAKSLLSYPWATVHDAIESDICPRDRLAEFYTYYRIKKEVMESTVCRLFPELVVPMKADFEIGPRWDGNVTIVDNPKKKMHFTPKKMFVKGQRHFYEETLDQFRKADVGFTSTILESEPPEQGEDVIIKKAYEGESNCGEIVLAEIEFNNSLEYT